METHTVVYLFCFALEESLPDIGNMTVESLGAAPGLSVVAQNGVAAVYGFAPLEDFVGPGAEEKLSDLDWIGPKAVFHARVVEEIASQSPVFPAPFGTIYFSKDSLEAFLDSHLDAVSSFLRFVSDKGEWAVKGFVNPEKIEKTTQRLLAESSGELPASPGARYLLGRRMRENASEKLNDWLAKTLSEVQQLLAEGAVDFRRREPLPESGLDEPAQMVANWAFLLAKGDEPHMESTVSSLNDRFAEEGLFFTLSGPWPPFSFTPPLDGGRTMP